MALHKVYLGLGSNIGNRKRNMREAVQYMESLIGTVTRQSTLYETEPWGFESPNLFINMCVCVETPLAPRQLLEATQEIEKRMGRVGKSENHEYQDRIIDIDILLYDDLTVDEPDLKIPHPLMNEREFVMNPLNEILKKK
ncbi:MAG: 2-amino-4-hydroxy-6-hydroxymethyldihydropteridine diphosphokinase [Prevotella sp.]